MASLSWISYAYLLFPVTGLALRLLPGVGWAGLLPRVSLWLKAILIVPAGRFPEDFCCIRVARTSCAWFGGSAEKGSASIIVVSLLKSLFRWLLIPLLELLLGPLLTLLLRLLLMSCVPERAMLS
jgi:hypothetical protein